jgi:hypothetical protein
MKLVRYGLVPLAGPSDPAFYVLLDWIISPNNSHPPPFNLISSCSRYVTSGEATVVFPWGFLRGLRPLHRTGFGAFGICAIDSPPEVTGS